MELFDYLQANMILTVFVGVCLLTFLIRLPHLCTVKNFTYSYSAKTRYGMQDHNYNFSVRRVSGEYRCYIERTPSFRGRDTSHYMPHYWVEQGTNRHYICWTGKIKYPEQAKTLCRNWSDATQQFIDTGVPAPGFERS